VASFLSALATNGSSADSNSVADATPDTVATGPTAGIAVDIGPAGVALAWAFSDAASNTAWAGSITIALNGDATAEALADSQEGVEVTADATP